MANKEKSLFTAQKIAELISYTPQSVRNAANALGIEHVSMDKKRFLYSEEQALAIAEYYGKKDAFQKGLEPVIDKDELIADLETQLEEMKKQLAGKDEEITTLQKKARQNSEDTVRLQGIIERQIETYSTQIENKDRQIENKDKQIETLIEQNKQLTANISLLNAADKKEALLMEPKPQEEKKKGLLARLFG